MAVNEKLEEIRRRTLENIARAKNLEELNEVRLTVLGKRGELKELMKGMRDLSAEERPKFGQLVNDVRQMVEQELADRKSKMEEELLNRKLASETIDVTLPAKKIKLGHRHPNTRVLDEVERIFIGMGYEVVEGPEIEYDYYNFEALNLPANHPAKDEQDTFYINKDILLRTQT